MPSQVADRTGWGQGLGAMREIKDNMQFDKVFICIRPLMAYVHCEVQKCSGVEKHQGPVC